MKDLFMFDNLRIEVEIEPPSRRKFETRYLAETGDSPCVDGYNLQKNRWGVQCRIYFNGNDVLIHNLRMMGYTVEDDAEKRGYRSSEYAYRVTGDRLFWRLIRDGFRIGDNEELIAKKKAA